MTTMTTTVNLRADAEAEVRWLTVVRSLDRTRHKRPNDTAGANGPLIARARGARRRTALAGGTLFMWHVACEDAAGRPSPGAIVGILASTDFAGGTLSQLRTLVDAIDANPPQAIQRVLSVTQREIADSVRAHARARLERERAIAADVAHAPHSAAYQAGLFDRRRDRDHERRNADARDAAAVAAGRVDAASTAATITTLRPTLLLVLTAAS
jgi:hypothetical protein